MAKAVQAILNTEFNNVLRVIEKDEKIVTVYMSNDETICKTLEEAEARDEQQRTEEEITKLFKFHWALDQSKSTAQLREEERDTLNTINDIVDAITNTQLGPQLQGILNRYFVKA